MLLEQALLGRLLLLRRRLLLDLHLVHLHGQVDAVHTANLLRYG